MTKPITDYIAKEVTALDKTKWPSADNYRGLLDRFHAKLEVMTTVLVDALDLFDADPDDEITDAVMDAQYAIDELHTLLTQLHLADDAIDSVVIGAYLMGQYREFEAELLALIGATPSFLHDEAKALSAEVLKNEQQAMQIFNQSLHELRS
jgi:hypothetical protein